MAVAAATIVTSALSALGGLQRLDVLVVGVSMCFVLTVWVLFDKSAPGGTKPGYPLAWILMVVVIAVGVSGSAETLAGPLERWYADLPFAFVQSVAIDRFVLGASAGLFLLATGNRIVRLVLEAARTPAATGEATLSGGRLLGPMERLFVAAMVLSGDLTGAAVIIAAKGFLRLPEIRNSESQQEGKEDHVTEYFLIGTFCSLLLAGGLAAIVLGSK